MLANECKEATVYVVDDDNSVRRALGRLIRSEGLAVKTFASAQQFLDEECCGQPDPHCLVLDVHMPAMSGLDLQDELKARHCHVPIIMITGQTHFEEARKRALQAGAVGFLIKPFHDQALLDAIRQALNKAEAEARAGTGVEQRLD